MAAVGQEHVVDSGIDGGDLVREVTPDTLNKTPHPEEDADSSGYRCDGVWSHADSVAEWTARMSRSFGISSPRGTSLWPRPVSDLAFGGFAFEIARSARCTRTLACN